VSSAQPAAASTPVGFAKVEKGEILIEVKNLKMYFPVLEGILFPKPVAYVKAVDGVSFDIKKGETLGLVGESGCGKTTTGRCILQLEHPTAGDIVFEGVNLNDLDAKAMSPVRQKIQVIFQDPYSSLNPRIPIDAMLIEAMRVHGIGKSRRARRDRAADLLEEVGLESDHLSRYPHEFSGGQRQRIGIARALALEPELIVCDEPISALDVSIQAQIINLLQELQKDLGLTYIFIAHDLSVVRHISDRIAVMYLGKIVEQASTERLMDSPQHPYTQALLSAVPVPIPGARRQRIRLTGELPSPTKRIRGCPFASRCPEVQDICHRSAPPLEEKAPGHIVACHAR